MKKKEASPFEKDTWKRLKEDPALAESFFEELIERPLAVQVSMLRRMRGISQIKLAAEMHITQSYLSKLEKEDSDHLIGIYEKLAKRLKGKLAIIPEGARIITSSCHSKLPHAA